MIILKDKTKIYISDLIYTISDDHYLNVFLKDGENHFVRSKLVQITEELPPNFIREVNDNFTTTEGYTQISLSHSYEDKF